MKIRHLFLALSVCSLLLHAGCKKDSKVDDTTPETDVKQFHSDANYYKSESDQADNDINSKLNDYPAFAKMDPANSLFSTSICGMTVDTSQIASRTLIFNFDGVTQCFTPLRTRSGQIKVQLTTGNFWHDVGSVLTFTYINFKVTRVADNRSIMFNGVKTLTNVNGNNWLDFFAGTSTLKYRSRAFNVAVSFDNGTNANWNMARITEWSYTAADTAHPARINFTATGDTALNGYGHVDIWGQNRYGQDFTSNVTVPVTSNTNCGLWNFTSGQVIHYVGNRDYTLTLGVDQNGAASTSYCAYGFKVTWQSAGGATQNLVIPYY